MSVVVAEPKPLPQVDALDMLALGRAWAPSYDGEQRDEAKLRGKLTRDYCQALLSSLRTYTDAIGYISYENHAMDSRNLGACSLVAFGPSNTITELPAFNARCPIDLGSTPWAYLATCWTPRAELRAVLESYLADAPT